MVTKSAGTNVVPARSLAIGLVLSLAVASCSNSTPPIEESDLVDSALFVGAYQTPLEPVVNPDPVQYASMQQAIATAVNACMTEKGFPDFRQPLYEANVARPYGVIDPDIAQVWGYQPEGGIGSEGSDEPMPQGETEDPAWEVAYLGTEDSRTEEVRADDGTVLVRYDPEACRYPAILGVFPDYPLLTQLQDQAYEMSRLASEEVLASDEFDASFDEWDECVVAAGGVAAASHEEAIMREGLTFELTEAEIAAAVRDATCKQETGFIRTWSLLQAQEEHQRLADSPGLVTEYLELLNANPSG